VIYGHAGSSFPRADDGDERALLVEADAGTPRPSLRAYLGLGSNVGDRERMLTFAADLLAGPDVRLIARSHIYESPPWGKTDQRSFLNQVLEVETTMPATSLLDRCRDVEQALGRVRIERWGPRTIDVDILLYDDAVIQTPDLIVPHPEMRRRAFVLVPLAELAPALRLPTGEMIADLVAALPDPDTVRIVA
jgi:2-amino-4-hydroxy-6-hydroxymethyldihydropteridine diphosphokinase